MGDEGVDLRLVQGMLWGVGWTTAGATIRLTSSLRSTEGEMSCDLCLVLGNWIKCNGARRI